MGKRHFGILNATKNEVIILGYDPDYNEVLLVVLAALPSVDAMGLKNIVLGNNAQMKDYLMDSVSGSILSAAHHPSNVDWQSYLLKLFYSSRGTVVRRVSMKDVTFSDESQHAFFGGYGPSIEPDIDAKRRTSHAKVQEDRSELLTTGHVRGDATANVDNNAELAPFTADLQRDQPSALETLTPVLESLMKTQNAILEKLNSIGTPAKKPRKPRKPRTTATKPKVVAKVVAKKVVEVVAEPLVNEDVT